MIDICMTYRSLFLENEGDYSDYAISLLTERHKWKPRINAMLRDLRLLYARSREAGALDPRWIKEIYGDDQKAIDKIKQMKIEFDEQLNKLNRTAADVLAEPEPSQDKFDAFVQALDEFRTKTNERDTPFLTKILEHLRRIVGLGEINLELAGDIPTEVLLDGEKVKEPSTQTAASVSLPSGQH
jgi:hypothetical protein